MKKRRDAALAASLLFFRLLERSTPSWIKILEKVE
jgi:hypothetical protein